MSKDNSLRQYVLYEAALEITCLTPLKERRAAHSLELSRRAALHPIYWPHMFQRNQSSK